MNTLTRELARSKRPVGSRDKLNRLQAACSSERDGVRLRLWVNGKLAAEALDTFQPLQNKGFGLYIDNHAGPDDPKTVAAFDDFFLGRFAS